MKSLNKYIQEKLVINNDIIIHDSGKLYDTFNDTIKKNFDINNIYRFETQNVSSIKYDVDDLLDGKTIRREVMDKIDDILEIMRVFGMKNPVQYYDLDEFIYDYKAGSFYNIIKNQCECIFGEDTDTIVYFTNYFSDYCVLGIIMNNMEAIWIIEK